MHDWSEEDFDWKGLDNAGNYIYDNCRRWSRSGLWIKEKWGTLRISHTCAFASEYDFIHSILKPGHAFYRYPLWFRKYVDNPLSFVLKNVGVIWLVRWYQVKVLKYFWKRAAKKWPHLKEEILSEYEFYFGDR